MELETAMFLLGDTLYPVGNLGEPVCHRPDASDRGIEVITLGVDNEYNRYDDSDDNDNDPDDDLNKNDYLIRRNYCHETLDEEDTQIETSLSTVFNPHEERQDDNFTICDIAQEIEVPDGSFLDTVDLDNEFLPQIEAVYTLNEPWEMETDDIVETVSTTVNESEQPICESGDKNLLSDETNVPQTEDNESTGVNQSGIDEKDDGDVTMNVEKHDFVSALSMESKSKTQPKNSELSTNRQIIGEDLRENCLSDFYTEESSKKEVRRESGSPNTEDATQKETFLQKRTGDDSETPPKKKRKRLTYKKKEQDANPSIEINRSTENASCNRKKLPIANKKTCEDSSGERRGRRGGVCTRLRTRERLCEGAVWNPVTEEDYSSSPRHWPVSGMHERPVWTPTPNPEEETQVVQHTTMHLHTLETRFYKTLLACSQVYGDLLLTEDDDTMCHCNKSVKDISDENDIYAYFDSEVLSPILTKNDTVGYMVSVTSCSPSMIHDGESSAPKNILGGGGQENDTYSVYLTPPPEKLLPDQLISSLRDFLTRESLFIFCKTRSANSLTLCKQKDGSSCKSKLLLKKKKTMYKIYRYLSPYCSINCSLNKNGTEYILNQSSDLSFSKGKIMDHFVYVLKKLCVELCEAKNMKISEMSNKIKNLMNKSILRWLQRIE